MAFADKLKTTQLSTAYRAPVVMAVSFQIVALIFTSLLFDFGVSFNIAAASLVLFWLFALIIISRRPIAPTAFDRRFIAHGYPVLVALLFVINTIIDS